MTTAKPRTMAVSLVLTIDGQGYRAERSGPAAVRLHKLGPEGLAYDLASTEGGVTCTCPASTHHKATRCKHAEAALQTGLVIDAPAPEPEPISQRRVHYRGSNGLWYDDERQARTVYSWQQDDPAGRERP